MVKRKKTKKKAKKKKKWSTTIDGTTQTRKKTPQTGVNTNAPEG